LENVSQYFDKAGEATGISKDMLNFLKSPDYSLKFNIPYRTGNPFFIQTPESLKSLKPSEFNTRLTDSQLKEEQDTHFMSQLKKLKHCPVS